VIKQRVKLDSRFARSTKHLDCLSIYCNPLSSRAGSMKKSAVVPVLLALAEVSAFADPIDNPGNFVWDTGTGALVFNQSSSISRSVGTILATATPPGLDIDLDSAGNIAFNAFNIAPVTINGYVITLLVNTGSSSGKIVASDPSYNSTFDLSIRIRVQGNGITGTSCTTTAVVRDFEGAYVYDSGTDSGDLDIWSGSSGTGSGDWLAIPALTGGCLTQETTINNLLGLGTSGALSVQRLGANIASGAPRGS
jgi:hypothetical protein